MYYLIGTEKQFKENDKGLKSFLPDKVRMLLRERVKTYEEYYGKDRDLEKSLGGYCVVFLNTEQSRKEYKNFLKKYGITEEWYEYQDEIADEGGVWIEKLYLLSNDYGIIFFYQKDMMEGVDVLC